MPRAVPVPIREVIQKRALRGHDVGAIAASLHLSQRTVRHILQRLREHGSDSLKPNYSDCGREALTAPSEFIQEAIALRKEHPTWGAGLIRVMLGKNHVGELLPCERTLQRWLQRTGGTPAPAGRRPAVESCRAGAPHDVWQMDAADQVFLKTGAQISWLRLVDECSGAVLQTEVFPPRVFRSSSRDTRAKQRASGFFAVGTSTRLACRQWQPLGIVERFADRFCPVVDRLGHRHDLEPAGPTARQRHGGTIAGNRQTLGGTQELQHARGAAGPARRLGSDSAGRLSHPRRLQSHGVVSATAPFGTRLYGVVGEEKLELGKSLRAHGGLCGHASRRQNRANQVAQPQFVHRRFACGPNGLCDVRPAASRVDHRGRGAPRASPQAGGLRESRQYCQPQVDASATQQTKEIVTRQNFCVAINGKT